MERRSEGHVNGDELNCPPTQSLEALRVSSSSDVTAATLHNDTHAGNFKLCEVGKQESGDGGLTGPLAQVVFSDIDFDSELDTDEEELMKLGDGIWVHEGCLAYLREPKDVDIILFCQGDPGMWMAIAPEWQIALGFGTTIEEASEDLQSALVGTKLLFIDEKLVDRIKRIPMEFIAKRARMIRKGWCDGYYDEREKAYFDDYEKDSSAVEWRTIQV